MKKILLSLSMLLTGVGAWAQEYDLTTFEVTTNESQPKTYVMESRRPRYTHPDWFLDGVNVKMQQGYNYAAAEKEEKNKFLFYFTEGSNGGYYIHPYNAEDGHVLGVASAAANAPVVVVDKANPGAIEWTLGELTEKVDNNDVTRKYFKATIGETEYCLQDNSSGSHVIIGTTPSFVSTALNFGKRDPYIPTAQDVLTDAINTFEYKIAYQCLGEEEGQFVDAGDAYKTAYGEAQDAITAGTGDFETLLEKLETAFEALEYVPIANDKYYAFKSKKTEKYLYIAARGNQLSVNDNIFVFKLVAHNTNAALQIYIDEAGRYVNGLIWANHAGYSSDNKFYKLSDGSFIISVNNGGGIYQATSAESNVSYHTVTADAIDKDETHWYIEEIAPSISITDAQYATFYAPVAVTLPAGVSAYYVSSVEGNSAIMTQIEAVGSTTTIPASTGVILHSETEVAETTATIVENNSGTAITNNLLSGTTFDTFIQGNAYILANGTKGVGLYEVILDKDANGAEGTTHFQNNAFKAYLPASAVSTPDNAQVFLGFSFGNSVIENLEGTETAIEGIQGAENADAVVYDLVGRRVKGAQKGLYIVNGKVVVK